MRRLPRNRTASECRRIRAGPSLTLVAGTHIRYEDLADGGAHTLATLAEDRDLRASLAGGATAARVAKARKARRMSKARKAKLAEYRGDLLVR